MDLTNYDTKDSTLVTLAVSIWSGRAKLTRDDLSAAADALPPDTLAMLGQKKLIDPDLLKPIVAVKSHTLTVMNRYGIKMLGGWMLHDSYLPAAATFLDEQASKFNDYVANFLSAYRTSAQEWAHRFPEWETQILCALPETAVLEKKFNFSFRAYKLAAQDTGVAADDGVAQLKNMKTTAYTQLAEELALIYNNTFKDGKSYRANSLNALEKAAQHAANLVFTDGKMAVLSGFLQKLVDKYKPLCKDVGAMGECALIVKALSDPATLADVVASQMSVDIEPTDFLDGVLGAPKPADTAPPVAPQQPEAAAQPEATMVNPEPAVQQDLTEPTPKASEPVAEPAPASVQETPSSSADDGMADLLESLGF